MDSLALVELGAEEFDRRLRAVKDTDWVRPTPCDEWTVRGLVQHVVGSAKAYLLSLDGRPDDEIAHALTSEDAVGAELLEAWDSSQMTWC